jgi:hypothetical protein
MGTSLAVLFAAIGVVIASEWFRRHGGFLLTAALAIVASALPYLLFTWTSERDVWPWGLVVTDWIAWLRFEPRPRAYGIAIQIALALLAVAAVAAQLALWRIGPRSTGRPRPHRPRPTT